MYELAAAHFINQTRIAPRGKQIDRYAERDKRCSEPERWSVRMRGRHVRRDAWLVEQLELRNHQPEPCQSDAGTNPREKRSLFRKIIPQVSRGLLFD
ncbi:MAG: hypothetical protein QOD74_2297 [Variibacter sp.]|nr:hypothetical protein [Variibacter sp.]